MPDEGITVTGTGRVAVAPDQLVAALGAEVVASSVRDALSRCSLLMRAMSVVLDELGVAEVATTGASVYAAPEGRGWQATQQLTARLADLDTAGDTLTAALAAGGDAARLYSLTPTVARDTAARAEARRLAFADALATARQYAELAGRELGVVESVTEGGGSPGGPIAYKSAAALPVQPGTLDVTTTVTVRWHLIG